FSSLFMDPIIDLVADLRLASSDHQTTWQFGGVGPGLLGFAGGIEIGPDNSIELITAAQPSLGLPPRQRVAPVFTRDVWHNVELVLDYTTQRYSFNFDGALVARNVPFCGINLLFCGGEHL